MNIIVNKTYDLTTSDLISSIIIQKSHRLKIFMNTFLEMNTVLAISTRQNEIVNVL